MASSTPSAIRTSRSARLGLRATPEQEAVLRRAADISHKSLTDFILDSACHAAEQTLLDQRLFMVSDEQYQKLLDMLDQPAQDNQGLQNLFSHTAMAVSKPEVLQDKHLLEPFDCSNPSFNEWLCDTQTEMNASKSATECDTDANHRQEPPAMFHAHFFFDAHKHEAADNMRGALITLNPRN